MPQDLSTVDTVLLDIEGTICPINFVKDTLFPYALNVLTDILAEKWNDPAFTPYRDAFPTDARTSPSALESHVRDLTARDVKVAYLKNLQGYLFQTGYDSGSITTPLYPDVLPSLTRWHSNGIQLAMYSSGSVFAQKLLMGHIHDPTSSSGSTLDRRDLISAWFDATNAGPKTESASYEVILGALGREGEAGRVLFLSDSVAEVRAAVGAGMQGVVVEREGNAVVSGEERGVVEVVAGFEGMRLEAGGFDG